VLYVLAAGVRVGWVCVRYADEQRAARLEYPDEEAYWRAARSLAAGRGLVDEFGYRATYMPAYPAFLAMFVGLARPLLTARLTQAALAALAAPMAFLVARRWGRWVHSLPDRPDPGEAVPGEAVRVDRAAAVTGTLVALDPFLVFFSGLLLTESLFTVVLLAAWWFVLGAARAEGGGRLGEAVLAGLGLTAGLLLRPSAIVPAVLAPGVVIVGRGRRTRRTATACVMVGVVVAGLFPWALRNRLTLGQWCWLTTRGGISLYDGLRRGATGASDLAHTKTIPQVQGLSETRWDAYFRARAWEAVQDDPLRVLRLAGRKFLRTWSLTPNVETYRRGVTAVVSAVFMVVVLSTAAVGWWVHRRSVYAWCVLLGPVAGFTLLHMIFVGSVRYRVPVLPLVAVVSGVGVVHLLGRVRRNTR